MTVDQSMTDTIVTSINQINDREQLRRIGRATASRLKALGSNTQWRDPRLRVPLLIRFYLFLSPYVFIGAFLVPLSMWLYVETERYEFFGLTVWQDWPNLLTSVWGGTTVLLTMWFGRVLRFAVTIRPD